MAQSIRRPTTPDTPPILSSWMTEKKGSGADESTHPSDHDTIADMIWQRYLEIAEVGNRITGKQGIRLLLASGLLSTAQSNPSSQSGSISSHSASSYYPFSSQSSPHTTYSPPTLYYPSSPSSLSAASFSPSLNYRNPGRIRILDMGCGQGTISMLITILANEGYIASLDHLEIIAADTNLPIMQRFQKRIDEREWTHIKLQQFAMESIELPAESVSYAFGNSNIHFTRDDDSSCKEIYRVLKPGGIAGFTAMKELGWRPASQADPMRLFPTHGWNNANTIRAKLTKHGFQHIEIVEHSFERNYNYHELDVGKFLVEASLRKLWNEDNNDQLDEESKLAIRTQLLELYSGGEYEKEENPYTVFVVIARKAL